MITIENNGKTEQHKTINQAMERLETLREQGACAYIVRSSSLGFFPRIKNKS